jgi:phage tail-like protein
VLSVAPLRPFALVRTPDQWRRAAHADTFVEPVAGAVELAWQRPAAQAAGSAGHGSGDGGAGGGNGGNGGNGDGGGGGAGGAGGAAPWAAGLAFDGACRLYRSVPDQGTVERSRWPSLDPFAAVPEPPQTVELFEAVAPVLGDFAAAEPHTGPLREPRGLAVDADDRLFIAEYGAGRILVFDLWSRRLLRRVTLPSGARPTDLAACGQTIYALAPAPASLFRLGARAAPVRIPLPAGISAPTRLATAGRGRLLVLDRAGTADARIFELRIAAKAGSAEAALVGEAIGVPFAGDIEWAGDDVLVVARGAGDDLLRFHLAADARTEIAPLTARGYDGLGIVRGPDGRIAFWTGAGLRYAVAARVRYAAEGRVTTFRLDAGEYQTVWGRLFVEACVPPGTEVVAHCATADEPPEEATLPRTAPTNLESAVVPRPDLSPPMPPLSLVPGDAGPWQWLHRRASGRELPWAQPAPGDPFQAYEAPILAPPGRYLWVTLRLRGTSRQSPRVRCIRAEHPTHDHMRRLPRTYSADTAAASFLGRYLAMPDSLLMDLDSRADERHALLDPRSAPAEVLPWLAGFLGLKVDERWPEHVLRQLIAEAVWLFRFRGTVPGLRRFLEICVGAPVVIIEHFRLRGLGGAILGEAGPPTSRAVVGSGLRVGGAIGTTEEVLLDGSLDDAFTTHAHRFTVVVPGAPTAEQLDAVRHILDVHRPAHTLFDVCTAGAGMRVGRGLHVGLASVIGRTGGFATAQLGGSVLGRGAIVGRPDAAGPGFRIPARRE